MAKSKMIYLFILWLYEYLMNKKQCYGFWLTVQQQKESVKIYFSKFFLRSVQLSLYEPACNTTLHTAKLSLEM